jgi:hypothetical protein
MRDLIRMLVIKGIVWLCRFIDWRERREMRHLALEQDW